MHKEMLAILVIWLTVLPSDATSLFAPAFFEAPPSSVVARGQGMLGIRSNEQGLPRVPVMSQSNVMLDPTFELTL
jgi:hypothetical protein